MDWSMFFHGTDRSAGDPAPRQQGFSGHHRHGHIDGIGAQQVKRESWTVVGIFVDPKSGGILLAFTGVI